MKKSILLFALLAVCYFSNATIKTVISNAGTGWQNGNNYLPIGIPQNGDIVVVPVGLTISVKGSIYGSSKPSIKLNVFGTLDFDPSGKLALGAESIIQIFALGKITTNGTSSELISIDGIIKYNGRNDGTLIGPVYASAGPQQSSNAHAGSGFMLGVLPAQLLSFTSQLHNTTVKLEWKMAQQDEANQFIVQRKNNGDWEDLALLAPSQTDAEYDYIDKTAPAGTSWYRLKIVGNNAAPFFSAILSVTVGNEKSGLSIFPNPASTIATIKWSPIKSGRLFIINSAGITLANYKIDASKNSLPLDLSIWSAGVYSVLISDGLKIIDKQTILHH